MGKKLDKFFELSFYSTAVGALVLMTCKTIKTFFALGND